MQELPLRNVKDNVMAQREMFVLLKPQKIAAKYKVSPKLDFLHGQYYFYLVDDT